MTGTHTHEFIACCGTCNRPDPSLTCARCAAATMLADRLHLLGALSSRNALAAAVESAVPPRTHEDAATTVARTAVRVQQLNSSLKEYREELRKMNARAATLRADVHARSTTLVRANTALRNAHALEVGHVVRSRDRAAARVASMRKTLGTERVRVLGTLRDIMLIYPGRLKLGSVKVPDFASLAVTPPAILRSAVRRLCILIENIARYLDVRLPYQIIHVPHLAIVRKQFYTVDVHSRVKESEYRRFTVSGEIRAMAQNEKKKVELDHFMEAVALLLCDAVYLCGDTASDHPTTPLSPDDDSHTSQRHKAAAYFDVAPYIWRAVTVSDPAIAAGSSHDHHHVLLEPAVVLVALRERNKLDADRRAWAEWQMVDAAEHAEDDMFLVDALDEDDGVTAS
ncbi:UV radiation resistance protein and autophagy-related subunit 14-domain-containing protein [Limtongia smithiae]|uniref:UV radiation resistance protein and autophagy-related subunit 14-domain-containing protein n=1 Tax=Limtongia smithiae TaxID=1125753 RepID=UPI0034CD7A70